MILKKMVAFILAVFIPFGISAAQNEQKIEKKTIKIYKEGKKRCLWRLTGSAGENGYVLATTYLGQKNFFPLPDVIEKAFDESRIILVEVDLSSETMLKNYKMITDSYTLKGKTTLKDTISPDIYNKMAERLKEKKMDIEGFKKMKPWMASQVFYFLALSEFGYNRKYGIDHVLLSRAGKKKVISLLSLKYHLETMDRFSRQEQEEYIEAFLKPEIGLQEIMRQIVDAWANGDIDHFEHMYDILRGKSEVLHKAFKRIRIERNRLMIPKIIQNLQSGKPTMVLVGAGQLPGEDGLLHILKSKGYSLTQL